MPEAHEIKRKGDWGDGSMGAFTPPKLRGCKIDLGHTEILGDVKDLKSKAKARTK